MSRKITINLSSNEIENLIKKIDNWSTMMNQVAEKSINETAEYGLKEIQKNYNAFPYTPMSPIDFFKTGSKLEKTVGMRGPQALYTEFGTGTEGALDPHPQKDEFGLNAYNSGKTIRPVTKDVHEITMIPEGELYWTYEDPETGRIRYTQGIPAGKQVYLAYKSTVKKAPKIFKDNLERVLKS